MASHQSIVPIAQAIKSLRYELSEAIAASDNENLRFELGPVELEFQVDITINAEGKAGAKGGVQFGVISLGEVSGETAMTRSRGKTHTIKLTLNPVTASGGDVMISNLDIPDSLEID